jgi:F0F1-type ATP synthase membrane subunit b/b'
MLELNSSFLWIFFLIWLLYFVLNRVFFKPIGGIILQREAKIAADSGRHENMVAQIEDRTRAVEERLSQAEKTAQLEKEIAAAEQVLLQQVSAFSAKIRQSYL